MLYLIASGKAGFGVQAGLAANGYGEHAPGSYSLQSALVCELVMTFMFVLVVPGSTHARAPVGFAGVAIGLAFTLVHPVSIPITNTSVKPARGTGPALFVGGWALAQLWLFWLAPLLGAAGRFAVPAFAAARLERTLGQRAAAARDGRGPGVISPRPA